MRLKLHADAPRFSGGPMEQNLCGRPQDDGDIPEKMSSFLLTAH